MNATSAVGGVLLAAGVAVIYQSLQIPSTRLAGWGPRAFPILAAIAVTICGTMIFWSGLRGRMAGLPEPDAAQEHPEQAPAPDGKSGDPQVLAVLALIVLAAVYVWLLGKIGYLLSTAIAAPLAFFLFDVRKPVTLLLAAVLCPLAYHLIFFELLGVFPPRGDWFDLAELLRP